MASVFILIDLTSGNVVGDFDSETEALDSLRQAMSQHGIDAISDYSLVRVEEAMQSVVGMQGALVRLASDRQRQFPESPKARAGD